MSLIELLSTARTLSRADRIRLVQYLIGDLAREEGVAPVVAAAAYPVWTPLHAFDAAATMLESLTAQSAKT
jgi:hypothetical protein